MAGATTAAAEVVAEATTAAAEVEEEATTAVVEEVTTEQEAEGHMVEVEALTEEVVGDTMEEGGAHMEEVDLTMAGVGVGVAITAHPEAAVITIIVDTTEEVMIENLHVGDVLRKNQVTMTKDHCPLLGTTIGYHLGCPRDTLMIDVMVRILVLQEVNQVTTTIIILPQTVLYGTCYAYTN